MDLQKELIVEFDQESERTRKILQAIPEDADFAWKPHEKSMTLGRLASHAAELVGDWPLITLNQDRLDWNPANKQSAPTTKAALLERFEKDNAAAKAALAAFNPADWDKRWQFASNGQVFIDQPKYVVWRNVVVNHAVHHRAQLGVYLRLLGAKIPGTYGPSADEM